jgi:hypothetical protein
MQQVRILLNERAYTPLNLVIFQYAIIVPVMHPEMIQKLDNIFLVVFDEVGL